MNAAKKQGLIERPPIVVVMGHVDHGKSTLLDHIRKANTVDKEAGGITQHVAAYEVEHERQSESLSGQRKGLKKRITFIDTPGHAAFQAIRARGANIADIAILVVAADDGVKAQTLEALASIKDAGIPFIVAINKIDKPNADVARTQASLMENNVYLEKLGGDIPWAAISAKQGTGVTELLDLVLLVAEMNAYTADPDAPAEGFVIEAHRDMRRGIAATLIIRSGTLASGQAVVAGAATAPVRIMENHAGTSIKSATFSSPVVLVGFDELPATGSEFKSYSTKRDAEAARIGRAEMSALQSVTANATPFGDAHAVPVVIRADTTGSIEAIEHEIERIGNERSRISVIQSGIGSISENDIKKAAASVENPAVVIGFNVKMDSQAQERARQHGIAVETFDIIYKLTERLEKILEERTPKQQIEEVLGRARAVRIFSSKKEVHVVGGAVSEGRLQKGATVRILRRNIALGMGKILGLQSFKQKADTIEAPNEFGAEIDAPFEIAPGDMFECITTVMR